MVNRKNDVQDIFDKVSTGWDAGAVAQPGFIIEDRENTFGVYLYDNKRVILIRKGRSYQGKTIGYLIENRLWVFPLTIFGSDEDDAEKIFLQAKEVCDRYTNVPWSTSTLGTSTTYRTAGVFNMNQDPRNPHFVIECEMELLEQFVDVVIA